MPVGTVSDEAGRKQAVELQLVSCVQEGELSDKNCHQERRLAVAAVHREVVD